jgi:hypothetical protein
MLVCHSYMFLAIGFCNTAVMYRICFNGAQYDLKLNEECYHRIDASLLT